MSFKSMFTFLCVLTLAAALAGCGGATNTNNANTNANRSPAPSPSPTIDRTNSNISREQYDKNRAEYERDKGSSTIGQGVNDSWIWFKTRAALLAASDLRDSTINVDVVNDMITLKGTVANAAQKASAERVAKGIEGQKGVKNELQIKPSDSAVNQMVNGNTKSNTNMKK
jgi:hypothetical protein